MTSSGGRQDSIQAELRAAQLAFRAGNLDQAETRVGRLAAQYPGRADVLTAQGMILMGKGDQESALAAFSASLEADGNQPETVAWAALACLVLERNAEAEELSRRLTELAPTNSRGFYLLSSALRAQDRTEEAVAAVDIALELQPDDPEFLVLKARLLREWNMPSLAVDFFHRSMSIRPTAAAGAELARIHLRDGHPEAALAILDRILHLAPPGSQPYELKAEAYAQMQCLEEAEKQWQLAYRHSGNMDRVSKERARVEAMMGRFDVAEAILTDLIERNADPAGAFSMLAVGRRMKPEDLPLIERSASLANSKLSEPQLVLLARALGKCFDDLADYQRAIRYFDEANARSLRLYSRQGPFDCRRAREYTDYLIEISSADCLRTRTAEGNPSELPLFVVGMVRSGTTLTETILGAHSKIRPGGEQVFWTDRLNDFVTRGESGFQYNHELVMQFADQYLQLVEPAQPGIRHVIDKNPGNFEIVGILHSAFSRSKFVYLKRHPADNLLSIWMTPMGSRFGFLSDRDNLVFVYREHLRLVRHLREVMPADRFTTVKYEELTSNPVAIIGELLDFLQLEREEACFHPEQNTRPVLTPSVYQVRQPINKDSQARWKNYEPWLGPFAELLNEE